MFANLTEIEKVNLKQQADQAYFNSDTSIMTDAQYDMLVQSMENLPYEVGCAPFVKKSNSQFGWAV